MEINFYQSPYLPDMGNFSNYRLSVSVPDPGFDEPQVIPVLRSMSLKCGKDPITRNVPVDEAYWDELGKLLVEC